MRAMDPSIIDHWCEQIRTAAAGGQRLRLQGAGSKNFHGAPLGDAQVLATPALSGILSYEPSELVLRAYCGTPLVEVQAALAERGQYLPFEPPHFGPGATVGGMVAAGLSGPARASAGAVRDYILGASLINGRGQHLSFGGQVMKNVAGYDLSRLMAGSWGTLGLITEVSLKVLPMAPGQATLACTGLTQGAALDLLHHWGRQSLPLNASAWLHDQTANPAQDFLFIRLRGAQAAVESAIVGMGGDASARGAQVSLLDAAQAEADWLASGEQTLPFFQPPSEDLCLWRLSLPQTTPALSLPYPQYIEWHGAQRWLWAPATAAAELRAASARAGGHASLFRASRAGGERDKAQGVFSPLTGAQQRVSRELQKQLDPAGVFNTGRLEL
ncbi:MAG: glycolate oxidase subunit GlcE [Betaproteobacteria bacterium]